MRIGFTAASANNDVGLATNATVAPAAAETLMKCRRVVLISATCLVNLGEVEESLQVVRKGRRDVR
jgi:hypothetical protein